VWAGEGQLGFPARATRATLTYSFPADGTIWGDGQNGPSGPNNLSAKLTAIFGTGNADRGREYIRQGLASWRRVSGLTYTEVADDNSQFNTQNEHVPERGDTRIAANAQGRTGILAYNYFPGASDMTLNSDYMNPGGEMGGSGNTYRYLRNVVAHEHGHGLGYIHPIPCDGTKLMEPFISLGFDMAQSDETRGAGSNYGDRFGGNTSGELAKDFGTLTGPSRSVIEQNLSTNGIAGLNGTDQDWYRFTLASSQTVTIAAAPTGGSAIQGQQDGQFGGCSGSTPTVNAAQAGNLSVELRTGVNGATLLQTAAAAGPGVTETLSAGTLGAGTYWARIVDVGPNPAVNQTLQTYTLTIRVGTSKAPPTAIAGLHKRVQANTTAFFIGNLNSYINEPGTSISTYAWDLDGDGTFEVANNATPNRTYVSNGTYPATLRCTDSNGQTAIDTINVTVFGATTTVATASPAAGNTSTTVPVTITGTNFKGVNTSAHVTVPGGGVTASGTPVVNIAGTQITGLSFTIASSADLGPRSIVVSNADGTGTGPNAFTINPGVCIGAGVQTSPASTSGCASDAAAFTVVPSGSSPFTYQWRKGGTPIAGANAPTLTLDALIPGDAGSYDCTITNPCGGGTSAAAQLIVNIPVAITAHPTPLSRCVGTAAAFTVSAIGTPAPTYQWRKNGVALGGQTANTLDNPSAQLADAGSYDCVITNSCGSLTSNSASLAVATVPTITTHPEATNACEDIAISLLVVASSDGPATYQWRRNSINVPFATAPIFTRSPVDPADAGSYDCVVTNACGSATSNPALLSVNTYAFVTIQPSSLVACLSAPAAFTLVAGGTAPIGFQWRKDGVNLPGQTASTLSIASVSAADLAGYDCLLTNACGTTLSSSAALGLASPPSITTQPGATSGCIGSPVSLTVAAAGTPPLSYQWRKAGTPIAGAASPTFNIPSVIAADAADYDCVVTNACASTPSNPASVAVDQGPGITTQPQDRLACSGQSAGFTVGAEGSPTFAWRRNGAPLSDGPTAFGSMVNGSASGALTVSGITPDDSGAYLCTVSTTCGSTESAAAQLTVDVAPAITTQPIGQSACAGATASLSVAATGPSLTYQWRRNAQPLTGAIAPTLAFPSLAPSSAGSYDCIVANICGSVTSQAAPVSVCAADFNCSGSVGVQDIFDFLAGYFSNNPRADINESGAIGVQDIFDFLALYFAGCA